MHKGDNSCFIGFPYLQSNTDLFKAEYTEHTMLSDLEISSKIPIKERGSFMFPSTHLDKHIH